MKKLFGLFGLCAAGILLLSCVRDNVDTTARNSILAFSLTIDSPSSATGTRTKVEPTEDEETVSKMMLIFYEGSRTYDGSYITTIVLDEGPYYMDQTYTLSHPDLSAGEEYNVIAIANIDDGRYISGTLSELINRFSQMTEKELRQNIFLNISYLHEGQGIESRWIPMTGAVTKPAGEGKIDITLKRIVSRMDVVNSAPGYELVSASVWNAYYRSSLLGDAVTDFSPVIGSRTRKFYNGLVVDNSVTGSLYAFENQVASPEQNDRFTTCLIVGLSQDAGVTVRYYRVNIHPKDSPQHLKRNNSYKVNITAVNGEGASTEEDAYTGIENQLIFTINYWDLDDNGLIVSDINSMIAIPVKTITFGKEGGTNSYTITTFSSLASPAPLALKSQIYHPADGSIVATLTGNILNVVAEPLPDGAPDRTGIITLTFAGLEATMNVLQSSSVDMFLTVTLDNDWTNLLPATPFASSENIFVNASGEWTAKLYDMESAFSFRSDQRSTELRSGVPSITKFRVYTWSKNESEVREGFVLISLDEDPLNYVSVVPIAQKVASAINIIPDANRITFDAAGNVDYTTNPVYTLEVTTNGAALAPAVLDDDTYFTINETMIDATSSRIEITAKGENLSGNSYNAILTLSDNGGGNLNITISQYSGSLYLQPSTVSTQITAVGGASEYIKVDAGSSTTFRWSATVTMGSSPGAVYNHQPYIELEDASDSGTSLSGIPVTKRFRIVFPKIYYPNRNNEVTATVDVSIDGTSLSTSITAKQDALESQGIKIWSSSLSHWGAINSYNATTYCAVFNEHYMAQASTLAGSAYSLTSGNATNSHAGGYGAFTHVHMCNWSMPANYNWSLVRDYMQNKDGLMVFQSEASYPGPVGAINNSPMGADYGYEFYGRPESTHLIGYSNNAASDTRVYKILFDRARNPIPVGQYVGPFTIDNFSSAASTIPSTGVKILQYSSSGASGNGDGLLVIDPTNRFIYSGDGSIYYSHAYMNYGNQYTYEFMYNYADYMCLTAMYGSHFTDMLIDYAPGDPKAVPAPWDDVWSANKWDPTSLNTIK